MNCRRRLSTMAAIFVAVATAAERETEVASVQQAGAANIDALQSCVTANAAQLSDVMDECMAAHARLVQLTATLG